MKKIIYIITIVGFAFSLKANPYLKVYFNENTTCGNDILSLAIMLEYSDLSSTSSFNLGNSSIFLNYSTTDLSFNSYVPLITNFDANNNWDNCEDVSYTNDVENGYINITLAEPEANPSNFPFDGGSNIRYVIGYLHFDIISQNGLDGSVYIGNKFTSFNRNDANSPNNGNSYINVENSFPIEYLPGTTVTNTYTIDCPDICEDLFTGSISNGLIDNNGFTTLVANVTPSGSYTYLWKNGQTSSTNPNQCYYQSNYVDVTDTDTNCTIRISRSRISTGYCSLTPTLGGGIRGNPIILTPIDGGTLTINPIGGNLVIPGPPRLDLDNSYEIVIQPNPTNGLFTINFKEFEIDKATLKVYSLTGKLVKEKSIAPEESAVSIDASNLNSGMYLVRIIANGGDELYADKLTIAH